MGAVCEVQPKVLGSNATGAGYLLIQDMALQADTETMAPGE